MAKKTANDNGGREILGSKLIVEAKREREFLLHQIEESQKTIARSYALIKQLDAVLANTKEE